MGSGASTLTPRPRRNYASRRRSFWPSPLHHVLAARGPLPPQWPRFRGRRPRATKVCGPSSHLPISCCLPCCYIYIFLFSNSCLLPATAEDALPDSDSLAFDPTQRSPQETQAALSGDGNKDSSATTQGPPEAEKNEDDTNMEGLSSLVEAIATNAAVE